MLIIPAIDIRNGRCVRLRQGDMSQETVYADDPVAVAERWVQAGARRLHVVDLDGAMLGRPESMGIVHEIVRRFPDLPVQVGGGIRDEDAIQSYLDTGAHYVILGTRAIGTPHFIADVCIEFPGHIIVSLDAKDNKLATEGWSKLSRNNPVDVAHRCAEEGVAAIIYTDVNRDGMMSGLNVEVAVRLCREVNVPIIAAGGIASLDDIRALCAVAGEGIVGAVTGRAIYEGRLDFIEAQRLADTLCPPREMPQ